MRVLVTGHEGYIGSILTQKLIQRGHDVVGLDIGYFADCNFVSSQTQVPTIRKDIRAVEAADLRGFEAIMHLAALSNDPLGDLDPELTLQINGYESVRLARHARSMGVRRFLFSSSCSMYGVGVGNALDEQARMVPQTAYARSKIIAEEGIRELADNDFCPTYLRNATAYGHSPRLRFDLVVNNLVGWAATTGQVKIMSDGTAWRPLVHVADIADAFIALMEAPADVVNNQAFNIGRNDENYQVRDIADAVQRVIPGCEVVYGSRSADTRSYRVDFSKVARLVPSFKASWTIQTGIEELYDVVRRRGLDPAEFESRKYTRLKQLKYLLDSGLVDQQLRVALTNAA